MKGQVWSTDFVSSVVVFFISVVAVLFIWNYSVYSNSQQTVLNDINSLAIKISDSLVRTGGLPFGWNDSSVQLIGLASQENVLNTTKVDYLTSMGYDTLKNKLKTGGSELYLEIRYINGSVATNSSGQELAVGTYPSAASMIVPVERYVLLNELPAKMRLMLWY